MPNRTAPQPRRRPKRDDNTARIPRPVLAPDILRAEPPVAMPPGSIRMVTDDQPLPAHDSNALGRVDPARSQLGWTWAHEDAGLSMMALWLERASGKGEDAQPTFLYDPHRRTGLLATYDGTGGSGSATVRTDETGRELSGAFLAARLARRATESWFGDSLNGAPPASPEADLHDVLQRRFGAEVELGIHSSDKFTGSLRRELPTTLAATAFHNGGDGQLHVSNLWAGDSRCHVLTPSAGLQQLTVDDSPIMDALDAIVHDAPMSNVVCADRAFTINRRDLTLPRPSVLISSTDGCFGYVATPAHFEYLLLHTLEAASSAAAWADLVLAQIDQFTGDDASLVLAAVGWSSFAELRASFAPRAEQVLAEHWAPFDGVAPDDRETFSDVRLASWTRYKPYYEHYLPNPETNPETAPSMAGQREEG